MNNRKLQENRPGSEGRKGAARKKQRPLTLGWKMKMSEMSGGFWFRECARRGSPQPGGGFRKLLEEGSRRFGTVLDGFRVF